ncbi:hypothetical protein ACHAWO_013705 [Cyclotella atomus]|uniref:Uncharacterized protein n=1 Tax=Cyclotella atomus TaxID=382360 RepID=A0ABD3PF62_9STRA
MNTALHYALTHCLLNHLMAALTAVQSFSPDHRCTILNNSRRQQQQIRLFEEYMSEDYNPNPKSQKHHGIEDINYGIGGVNLSKRWMELVSDGHVTAITELKEDENANDGICVRYGVRLEDDNSQLETNAQQTLLEFAEILSDQSSSTELYPELYDHITSINTTLSEMQQRSNGMAMEVTYDGQYAIQLQLVRTLRPKRSKDMSSKKTEGADTSACSCQPPPYESAKDSFLVGKLRLFGNGEFHGEGDAREKAAQVTVPTAGDDAVTPWDVFHNISPVDPRGHFLLLPDISDKKQWRDQSLDADDCYNLTYLASTIQPHGSMVLSFNSVSAGASQNHIHAHAWLNPPPPLRYRNDPTAEYDSVYAVTKSLLISSLNLDHGVTASLLKYPCTCVKLSASSDDSAEKDGTTNPSLIEMGNALYKIITVAQKMEAPHNVVWMNKAAQNDQTTTDVYVFFRKSESVELDNETFRLGASEMLGVFHATSKEQMKMVKKYKGLSCYGVANVLSDVSYEPREHIWAEVSSALGGGGKKISRRLQALQKAELYKKEKSEDNGGVVEATGGYRNVRTGVPYFDNE